MTTLRPGTVLRNKVNERRGLLVAGAANALAARLIEQLGFEAVYLTGADDGVDLGPTPARSGFFNAAGVAPALHSFHAERGLGCESCHVSHGSTTLPHLLRADGFAWTVPAATDGACGGDCHKDGETHGYKR